MSLIQRVPARSHDRSPRQSADVREAIAAIKAQHQVTETSAYAMLIRDAIGAQAGDPLPPPEEWPRQRRPLED
jgi:hypothetical protein